jgi:hypothetical protein
MAKAKTKPRGWGIIHINKTGAIYAVYRWPGHPNPHWRRCPTEDAAEALLAAQYAERKAAKAEGREPIDPGAGPESAAEPERPSTFRQLAERWEAAHSKSWTGGTWRNAVRSCAGT